MGQALAKNGFRRTAAALGALGGSLGIWSMGCGMERGGTDTPHPEVARAEEALLADLPMGPWPQGKVNVCFDDTVDIPDMPAYLEAKAQFIAAAHGSWEQAARIKYTFLPDCNANPIIRVALLAQNVWTSINGVSGSGGAPGVGVIGVGYCVPSLAGSNCADAVDDFGQPQTVDRLELVRAVSMHELGHFLGFFHEHQRTDTDSATESWCFAASPTGRASNAANAYVAKKTTFNFTSSYRGPYDKDSVMNYCRDQNNDHLADPYRPWNTINDRLSEGDKAGAVAIYGLLGSRHFFSQDYDGDGQDDRAVFRPSEGVWHINPSTGGYVTHQWGTAGDIPVPGDYDGDGKTDPAIFRPSTGRWWVLLSTGGFTETEWGVSTDRVVPGDYDGDGKTDPAVYRPSVGRWLVLRSTGGYSDQQWGISSDLVVPGDYDGDGKTDPAVYRSSSGRWLVLRSTGGSSDTQWGGPHDRVVPGDYDGDGRADPAVFRESTATWFVLFSGGGSFEVNFGESIDRLVPADFDGDNKTDVAVFRKATGNWAVRQSHRGEVTTTWGISSDVVPYAH